jgi:hypothetical protein
MKEQVDQRSPRDIEDEDRVVEDGAPDREESVNEDLPQEERPTTDRPGE